MAEDNKTTKPSYPQSATNDFVSAFEFILHSRDIKLECAIPAIVVSYDRKTHDALVKPLVKMVTATKESLSRASMTIHVQRIQHGGMLIDIPIYPGDTGWIIASDRDATSAFEKNSGDSRKPSGSDVADTDNKGDQIPTTYAIHSYANGFFIPDRFGSVETGDDDNENIVVKSIKSGISAKIGPSGVSVSLPGMENLFTIDSSGITINGNVKLSGKLTSASVETDSINVSGTASAKKIEVSTAKIGDIDFASHKHDVTTTEASGTWTSGGPK